MIKHYIKIAFRSIGKQKILSLINISGLSIGLACFFLFLLYTINEFSFDRFHSNADNTYRMYRWVDGLKEGESGGDVYMPSPLGPALKQDFPDDITDYTRLQEGWNATFVKANDKTIQIRVNYADPQFLDIFSFRLIYGNKATALKELNNVVLTKAKAKELFGEINVMGRTIEVKVGKSFVPFLVTGIAENIPANSSITFEALGNFAFLESTENGKRGVNNWNRSAYLTFVKMKPGSGLVNDYKRLAAFRAKYYPEEIEELKKEGYKIAGDKNPVRYEMQPLQSMHTNTKIFGGTIPNINPKNVWILLLIASGVLLIACINFTTLCIGRSARRAKEIGLRKVVGGLRKQLAFQFLAEAVIMCAVSATLGLLLAYGLLPFFNNLSGRELNFSVSHYPEISWMIAGLVLLVGLLSGIYPAVILSGFKPLEVLKNKVRISGSNLFTKSLITAQFTLSVGLIISTIVILNQTKYMAGKSPGFNRENVVMVNAQQVNTKKVYPVFSQELAASPGIVQTAGAELALGENAGWSRSGFEYNGEHKEVYEYYVDHNYIPLMGMQIVTGRNFNPSISTDTLTSVIVNEEMVKSFGWTNESAVGKEIKGYMESLTPVVIGVVKNFHFRPFKEQLKPQLFHQFADYSPMQFFVRVKPGNPAPALSAMEKAWKKAVTDIPFTYQFLDESIDNFYKSERRWSGIIGWAAGISIFLACLGLFGLASLAAANRTKEIGIRKVLGASLMNISALMTKDFIKLVILSLVIASPLAYYFMNKWLQDFAYRVNIGWWIFAAAGIIAVLIAFATVSFQAIKAAIANPVKSLRTE